jgi:hypothetical protein
MREIRTSGSMSGDGKRDDVRVATAPNPDSTEKEGGRWYAAMLADTFARVARTSSLAGPHPDSACPGRNHVPIQRYQRGAPGRNPLGRITACPWNWPRGVGGHSEISPRQFRPDRPTRKQCFTMSSGFMNDRHDDNYHHALTY